MHLTHEQTSMIEQIKDNKEKIKMNKQLPYLVANVVEVSEIKICRVIEIIFRVF